MRAITERHSHTMSFNITNPTYISRSFFLWSLIWWALSKFRMITAASANSLIFSKSAFATWNRSNKECNTSATEKYIGHYGGLTGTMTNSSTSIFRFLALGRVKTELDLASPSAQPNAFFLSSRYLFSSCVLSRFGQEQIRMSTTWRPTTSPAAPFSRVNMTWWQWKIKFLLQLNFSVE